MAKTFDELVKRTTAKKAQQRAAVRAQELLGELPPSPAPAVDSGDRRIIIRDVGWHVYDCLSEAIGEGQHIRLAYDGDDLEIMTAGYPHERYKEMFGKIVATVSRVKGIPRKTA